MKCRDCDFLSEPKTFGEREFPSVRCTLGLWDKAGATWDKPRIERWYSFGESQLNRGPVRRFGETCTQGRVDHLVSKQKGPAGMEEPPPTDYPPGTNAGLP